MLFSVAVLIALFLAVPFGIIMREPLSATISTFLGAAFFTLYVIFSFVRKRIRRAKIVTKSIDAAGTVMRPGRYRIEACRFKDHTLIRIFGSDKTYDKSAKAFEAVIAMPDSSRYSYIGLTGEHCTISDMTINRSEEMNGENYIPRIADEISFINVPQGDVPNVQIDGYRSASSVGFPIKEKIKLTFHTMSLPTARLVWH